ncbi:MAG: CapA family protein [Deltaproteobacteria bacterium]|jgi:poly-gamma-glutamate capsule biosynthesis protein CapA/YwtB (metallophosphatase superfamily)|nr:CapA family protein [Deltaproteobacteria bacterium]
MKRAVIGGLAALFLVAIFGCTSQIAGPVGPAAGSQAEFKATDSKAVDQSAIEQSALEQGEDKPYLRVAAMGDIMMGTENLLPPDGAAGFFKDVIPKIKGYDVIFGNLEGPLTDRGAPTKDTSTGRSYCFRTPPSYGQRLKDAGFNIVSLANNHSFDYGPAGRAQTEEVLASLDIAHTGAVGQITSFKTPSGIEVAFIGLSPNRGSQSINDIEGAAALVKEAIKQKPDRLVFVSFHGGAEGAAKMVVPHGPELFMGENRGDLIRLSHALIDAGAAAVIGHGPHVPRAVEVYRGHLIAYSLGNFATASGINVSGPSGLAPLLLFDLNREGQLINYEIESFRQAFNRGPQLDPTGEAKRVIKKLSDQLAGEL